MGIASRVLPRRDRTDAPLHLPGLGQNSSHGKHETVAMHATMRKPGGTVWPRVVVCGGLEAYFPSERRPFTAVVADHRRTARLLSLFIRRGANPLSLPRSAWTATRPRWGATPDSCRAALEPFYAETSSASDRPGQSQTTKALDHINLGGR